ncbi:YjdJ family protein [Solibacillus cecembensis]|uniref:YjdJ family protein n=1 Tax=Solibacillus cecembensis TaxID=459347 RepID=UPI003D03DB1C
MFKYVLQIIVGFFILALSTLFTLYEGSAITDLSWEWRYSTPFSNLFNIEIMNGHDISQLDYFVYAAKYQPLFPVIMLISIFYILNVFGYYVIRHQPKWRLIYWGLISCNILLFNSLIFNSPTVGGRIFFWITLIMGVLSIAVTVFVYLKKTKIMKPVDVN